MSPGGQGHPPRVGLGGETKAGVPCPPGVPEEVWVLVTWAGLHEAGLAAEPVGRAAAPRQGRPQQISALEGEARPTGAAAAAPARPGRQPTVHCRGKWGDSEEAHRGRALSGVPQPGTYHSRPRPSCPGSLAAGHSAAQPAGTPHYRSSAGLGSRGLSRPTARPGPWWAP